MSLRGFDTFRAKIPWLSGKKIIILPVYAAAVLTLALLILTWFDALPGLSNSSTGGDILYSLLPLLGELVVGVIGFSAVFQMWHWRDRLKKKYGALSYQRIFLVGFGGVLFVLSLAINQFIHYWAFSPSFWGSSPLRPLALPLESFVPAVAPIVFWLRILLAAFFAATGVAIVARSLQAFGFDYMTVVYLYFPEESALQRHEIYSVLRHPAYAGALTIALGGLLSTFTAYSVVLYLLFFLGFYIHVHFVEERELVQRFGPSFTDYRRQVPAFIVRPGKVRALFGFIFGKHA